jgi:hypothetical protein
MNRQKLALLIVLVVLVLAVTWSFISAPRQKTVSSLKEGPGQAQQIKKTASISSSTPVKTTAKVDVKPAVASDERALRLDLLERELSGFKGYRRNIFKPIFTDEIKLMKLKAVASKPVPLPPVAVVAQKPVTPPVVQPVVEPETHQSTLAHFIFLGFVKKDNRKTIFLSKDKEIILVRKGEIFAKRYEPTVITDQALTIRVTDTGEEIVIPLNENKPLAAVSKK